MRVNRPIWILVLIMLLCLAGAAAVVLLKRQTQTTPAMRGKKLAQALGCFGCHGPEGQGGVADPTSPSGAIPDWRYGTAKMFVKSEKDIREWILHGSSQDESKRRAYDDHQTLVPMPAYDQYLSAQELDDLVMYFLAVSQWCPQIPDDAFEGYKVATRLGCFGCHGPSGMGGVANPGSFKGYIPSWDGDDYTQLVYNENELREWILEGTIKRLWDNPAARFFLERQKTPMPAYHDHLSDAQLNKLVVYINWLRASHDKTEQDQREATTVIGSMTGVK